MNQQLSRRGLITGLISLVAAPAIVRATNIMPVRVALPAFQPSGNILTLEEYTRLRMADLVSFRSTFIQMWTDTNALFELGAAE